MEKVAIIGMGCLFPDYADKERFWNTIINGGDFLRQDEFLEKILERGGIPSSGTDFFSGRLTDAEIEELSSYGELFKWCAYIVHEALKDAGYTYEQLNLDRTGMIFGSVAQTIRDQIDFMGPFVTNILGKEISELLEDENFEYKFVPDNANLRPESVLADTEPIRYLAQKRGIKGPVITFNAACASPLYALRLAASYLNNHETDMVIAGAHCSNETVGGISGLFGIFGILCELEESRPLDQTSKGLITGSGAGAFVLKRLSDAQRDGDNILAVIESIGCSNDGGSSSGIMSPSIDGQIKAYEAAYTGDISRDIDYIECHATGTLAGDQTEMESIERFFTSNEHQSKQRPLLGALKGSTGHFFTATACASIVKVVMALQHEVIPATIRVDEPIYDAVILENTPWKAGEKIRRAGINAFGFGGINAHLVLSEYQPTEKKPAKIETTKAEITTHQTELAITGMGLKIGRFDSVEAFLQGLLKSETGFIQPDGKRFRGYEQSERLLKNLKFDQIPKGSYINAFPFDTMRFKMPTVGNPYFLRRDMLLLETTAQALDDAGIDRGDAPRTAVIVHSAPDYTDQLFMATYEVGQSLHDSLEKAYPHLTSAQRNEIISILREDEAERETADNVPGMITNIRGCRISAHWEFKGPSFMIFEREASVFRCLELARFFIDEEIVDQVVIGLSSFSGELEQLHIQKELGAMGLMLEHGIAEGAVAFIVKSKKAAIKQKDNIYSVISSVALSGVSQQMQSEITATLNKGVHQANTAKNEISTIEIPKSYDPEQQALVAQICQETYGDYFEQSAQLSAIEDYLGFGFSLSAAASIIRHALQHYTSRLFTFDPTGEKPVLNWKKSATKRASLVTGYAKEGYFGCALMRSCEKGHGSRKHLRSGLIPIPIPFETKADLMTHIQLLENFINKKQGLKQLYTQAWDNYQQQKAMHRAVVMLCDSKEMLQHQLDNFKQHELEKLDFSPNVGDTSQFTFEPFIKEAVTKRSLALFTTDFGLAPELVHHLNLGDALAKYKPVHYLLTLGTKLMLAGIPFDVHQFFANFDFYKLKQPSFVKTISTGMPDFVTRVDSPKNRQRISEIKSHIAKPTKFLLPTAAIPKFYQQKKQSSLMDIRGFYEGQYTSELSLATQDVSNFEPFKVAPEMRMINRILSIQPFDGKHGLGTIIATLELDTTHPIFEANETLSKSWLAEGVHQLQAFYGISSGYLTKGRYTLQNNQGVWTDIDVLIKPTPSVIRYELHISAIKEAFKETTLITNCEIYWQDTLVYKLSHSSFKIQKI